MNVYRTVSGGFSSQNCLTIIMVIYSIMRFNATYNANCNVAYLYKIFSSNLYIVVYIMIYIYRRQKTQHFRSISGTQHAICSSVVGNVVGFLGETEEEGARGF